MGLVLITPPTSYPVTLAEAKEQCRVDGSDEDAVLNRDIAAATAYVEAYTGSAIMTQTWELVLDRFNSAMALPKGPVQSVISVKYIDPDGFEQTATPESYTVDLASAPAWVVVNSAWPATMSGVNMVKVRFVAGQATADPAIKQAILLLIGDWYEARANTATGTFAEMPHAVTALLTNHRAFAF